MAHIDMVCKNAGYQQDSWATLIMEVAKRRLDNTLQRRVGYEQDMLAHINKAIELAHYSQATNPPHWLKYSVAISAKRTRLKAEIAWG